MQDLAALVLTALLAVNAAIIVATSRSCPRASRRISTPTGFANGFMQHGDYLLLMGGLAIGIPLLLAVLLVVLPCFLPTRLRIPSRDYWIGAGPARQTRCCTSPLPAWSSRASSPRS